MNKSVLYRPLELCQALLAAVFPSTLPFAVTVFLMGCCIFSYAHAGAWVQGEGNGLAITTLKWYQSDRYWDQNSNLQRAPKYSKHVINPFFEYGATPDITVGFNAFLSQVEVVGEGRSLGLGDVEVFARRRVWQGEQNVVSAQLLLNIPELGGRHTPPLGGEQYDVEARLLYGRSGQWSPANGSEWYFNLETGARKRLGAPADELRLDWLYGWRSGNKRWEIELKQENIIALQRDGAGDVRWSDYDLHKLSPIARYWVGRDWAVQGGISVDIAGRKSGQGIGPFVALWMKF